jgi:hypothetical protein
MSGCLVGFRNIRFVLFLDNIIEADAAKKASLLIDFNGYMRRVRV